MTAKHLKQNVVTFGDSKGSSSFTGEILVVFSQNVVFFKFFSKSSFSNILLLKNIEVRSLLRLASAR